MHHGERYQQAALNPPSPDEAELNEGMRGAAGGAGVLVNAGRKLH